MVSSDGPDKRQKGPSGLYVKSSSGEFVELAAANDAVCDDLRAELLKVAAINRDAGRRMVVSFEEEAPVEPRRIVNLSAGCAVLPVEVLRKAQQQCAAAIRIRSQQSRPVAGAC